MTISTLEQYPGPVDILSTHSIYALGLAIVLATLYVCAPQCVLRTIRSFIGGSFRGGKKYLKTIRSLMGLIPYAFTLKWTYEQDSGGPWLLFSFWVISETIFHYYYLNFWRRRSIPISGETPLRDEPVQADFGATALESKTQARPIPHPNVYQDALEAYIATWDSIPRESEHHPYPNVYLTDQGMSASLVDLFTSTQVLAFRPQDSDDLTTIVTQTFFLNGNNISYLRPSEGTGPKLQIHTSAEKARVKALLRYLKLKELPRWQPDWFCRRTGVKGVRDESLGTLPGIVAVRTGVTELIERCEEFLEGC